MEKITAMLARVPPVIWVILGVVIAFVLYLKFSAVFMHGRKPKPYFEPDWLGHEPGQPEHAGKPGQFHGHPVVLDDDMESLQTFLTQFFLPDETVVYLYGYCYMMEAEKNLLRLFVEKLL